MNLNLTDCHLDAPFATLPGILRRVVIGQYSPTEKEPSRLPTAQVVGPLVQHALHGTRGPLVAPARRGDAGPASHPGPGGGVTATAWEHQLRVPGAAPAPGAVGVDAAERPPERGEGGAGGAAPVAPYKKQCPADH